MNQNIRALIQDPTLVRGISTNVIVGSCGAYFFNSLFDGHPEILPINIHSMPSELDHYYFYYLNRFPMEKCQDVNQYLRFIDAWGVVNLCCGAFSIPEKASQMRDIMRECFINLNGNIAHHYLYYIQYIALAAVINYPLGTKNPIIIQHRHYLYPHHFKEAYAELKNDYYINYIRLIRQPEKSLDFIFKNTLTNTQQLPPAVMYNPSYPFLYYYYNDLHKYIDKKKLFSVRFEDLHLNPEHTLRSCCKQMGIKYIPEILFKSTMYGKPFEFPDRHSQRILTSFSKERGLDKTPKYLSAFHKFLLNYFLEKFYIRYGYKMEPSRLFKALDWLFFITWILPLVPTYRELKVLIAFYVFYIKNPQARPMIRGFNNFISTIEKQPFFHSCAIDKTAKEKIYLACKPYIYWLFGGPIIDYLIMKVKVTYMLLSYRFNTKIYFPPLINELYE